MGMTREAIDAELRSLGYPVDKTISQPTISEKPTMTRSQIDAELASLGAPVETGFMHRAGQVGRGIAKGVGSMLDIVGETGRSLQGNENNRIKILQGQPLEVAMRERREGIPEYGRSIPESIGLGEQYEPAEADTLGKVLQTTGEFLAPTPLPGLGYANVGRKLAAEGIKSGAKELAKEAALSGAAATAIKASPRFTEEGTALGSVEDFAKGLFGIKAADTIVQKNILKTMARAPKKVGLAAATVLAKPNERVLGLAKEHGVELPFNIGMRSRPMNFMANNYLKSMFTSGVYEDALKSSNESMIRAVKKNIDELGPSTLKPSEASGEYRRFIEAEEDAAEKVSSQLYDEASKFLKKTDSVKPVNTAKFIVNMKEMLTRDIKSPATKKVASIIGNLADSWGIAPPKLSARLPGGEPLRQLEDNPQLLDAYLKQFSNKMPMIPVSKLIGVRKELGTITKFDPTIKGSESYLNGLRSVIDKDIDKLSNKEFLSKWREANSTFKTSVADRFRGDIARSLLSHEMPTEAYSLLNTPANIREIEKIAGKSDKSKEIFDSLKKAKVRDIFSNALQDESLRVSPFINVFNKKEKTSELLEALVGKPQFKKLSEISEIAEEFRHARQELLNTSGTAIASSDISKAEKLVKGALWSIFNGGVGYGIGNMTGALTGVLMPNLISRLVASPKFVNEARAYAIARQNNRKLYSETILKRLIKLTEAEQRLMMTEIRSIEDEKE